MSITAGVIRQAPSGAPIVGTDGSFLFYDTTDAKWHVTGAPADGEVPIWDAGTNTWIYTTITPGSESGFDFIIHDLSDLAVAAPPSAGAYQATEGGYSFKAEITLDLPIRLSMGARCNFHGMGASGLIAGASVDCVIMEGGALDLYNMDVVAHTAGSCIVTASTANVINIAHSRLGYNTIGIEVASALHLPIITVNDTQGTAGETTAYFVVMPDGVLQLSDVRLTGEGRWLDLGAELSDMQVQIQNMYARTTLDSGALRLSAVGGNVQASNVHLKAFSAGAKPTQDLTYWSCQQDPYCYLFDNLFIEMSGGSGNYIGSGMAIQGRIAARNVASYNTLETIYAVGAPGAAEYFQLDGIQARGVDATAPLTGVTAATARVNLRQAHTNGTKATESVIT